jgi:2-haloacid dehalogenase
VSSTSRQREAGPGSNSLSIGDLAFDEPTEPPQHHAVKLDADHPELTPKENTMPHPNTPVLVFDVLGTVVDETGSLRNAMAGLTGSDEAEVDVDELVDIWTGYVVTAQEAILAGDAPYSSSDELDLAAARLIARHAGLTPDSAGVSSLALVGHRLRPWPDSVAALAELAAQFTVFALSNATQVALTDLVAAGDLSFHKLISGEAVRSYKPDPVVYRLALEAAGTPPGRVMMVAAHPWDLRGAAAVGMRTAFVARPDAERPGPGDEFDLVVNDLAELRDVLLGGS